MKFTATFSEKKVHCSQSLQMEIKTVLTTNHSTRVISNDFYISIPEDCKNELLRLNITRNKNADRKLVYFQVFSDSVHQAELEKISRTYKIR